MMIGSRKKRPLWLALFLCFMPSMLLADVCQAQGAVRQATVAKVIDGDTLHFTDGRKIRFVGLNTPELDHQHGRHEAFAVAAKNQLLPLEGQPIFYQVSLDSQDRYGRHLYYLFDKDRISLASRLLSAGLGYRIAVPPNLDYQACWQQAEQSAREKRLGVWQQPIQWQPKAGFVIGQVTITSITQNRGGWWLATDQGPIINIPSYATDQWSARDVFVLEGRRVEARGWQHQRKSRQSDRVNWVWQVKHPNDLIRLP